MTASQLARETGIRQQNLSRGGKLVRRNRERRRRGWMDDARVSPTVKDVARIVAGGKPKDELLAKYPDLRDQDIELATRIVSAPLTSTLYYDVDEIRFRRHPDREPRVQISEFDKWVSGNNRVVRVRQGLVGLRGARPPIRRAVGHRGCARDRALRRRHATARRATPDARCGAFGSRRHVRPLVRFW